MEKAVKKLKSKESNYGFDLDVSQIVSNTPTAEVAEKLPD